MPLVSSICGLTNPAICTCITDVMFIDDTTDVGAKNWSREPPGKRSCAPPPLPPAAVSAELLLAATTGSSVCLPSGRHGSKPHSSSSRTARNDPTRKRERPKTKTKTRCLLRKRRQASGGAAVVEAVAGAAAATVSSFLSHPRLRFLSLPQSHLE